MSQIPLTNGQPASGPAVPIAGPAASPGPTRVIDVVAGQRVQGTVLEVRPEGQVLLGLLGGPVLAQTRVALTAGRSYEFVVEATKPHLVLQQTRAVNGVGQPTAFVDPRWLATGGAELTADLRLAGQLVASPDDAVAPIEQFLSRLARGVARASDIAEMQRHVGHDLEARVLRLAARHAPATSPDPAEVRALQTSLKARLLQQIAELPPQTEDAAVVRRSLDGLGRTQIDNAVRAENGSPLWLPLPVPEHSFLRDARMFLLVSDEARRDTEQAGAADADATIVLLLDLSQLGPVRVDVHVRDDQVSATFRAVEASTVRKLSEGKLDLQGALERRDLKVAALHMRPAPATGLPLADLMTPPVVQADPQRLVDLHA